MTDNFIYDVEPPVEHKRQQLLKGFDLLGRMAFQEGWTLDQAVDEIRFAFCDGARKYHGRSKEAAEAIGVHRNTFSHYLRGKRRVRS